MEEDDYESLPPESTMSTHMVAGAAAGIMEHSIMYPVDCIKVSLTKRIKKEYSVFKVIKVDILINSKRLQVAIL